MLVMAAPSVKINCFLAQASWIAFEQPMSSQKFPVHPFVFAIGTILLYLNM